MSELKPRHLEWAEIFAENFSKLPKRAQALLFASLEQEAIGKTKTSIPLLMIQNSFDYTECKSPIEMIFAVAYDLTLTATPNLAINVLGLHRQHKIVCGDKIYYADFCFDTDLIPEEYECKKRYRLVIECDGHDFHEKTKEQVRNNNERDMNLKQHGYDVIHFSGSQIFIDPMQCAEDALLLIIKNAVGVKEVV